MLSLQLWFVFVVFFLMKIRQRYVKKIPELRSGRGVTGGPSWIGRPSAERPPPFRAARAPDSAAGHSAIPAFLRNEKWIKKFRKEIRVLRFIRFRVSFPFSMQFEQSSTLFYWAGTFDSLLLCVLQAKSSFWGSNINQNRTCDYHRPLCNKLITLQGYCGDVSLQLHLAVNQNN